MKKDRNCGCGGATPYGMYPTMSPYGMPGMMQGMQPMQGMMPINMVGTYPNTMNNISSNTIEQQINTLEQQINSLENRVSTLENMANNSNSVLYSNSSNYNSSNYQMM